MAEMNKVEMDQEELDEAADVMEAAYDRITALQAEVGDLRLRNDALMRERESLISTKREQLAQLEARATAAESPPRIRSPADRCAEGGAGAPSRPSGEAEEGRSFRRVSAPLRHEGGADRCPRRAQRRQQWLS